MQMAQHHKAQSWEMRAAVSFGRFYHAQKIASGCIRNEKLFLDEWAMNV